MSKAAIAIAMLTSKFLAETQATRDTARVRFPFARIVQTITILIQGATPRSTTPTNICDAIVELRMPKGMYIA